MKKIYINKGFIKTFNPYFSIPNFYTVNRNSKIQTTLPVQPKKYTKKRKKIN